MRISRTVLSLIVLLVALAVKMFFGLDMEIIEPADPEGDGVTIVELLTWILPIAAVVFRVKATNATNALGVKTATPLN